MWRLRKFVAGPKDIGNNERYMNIMIPEPDFSKTVSQDGRNEKWPKSELKAKLQPTLERTSRLRKNNNVIGSPLYQTDTTSTAAAIA